jgi:hypothetical protein
VRSSRCIDISAQAHGICVTRPVSAPSCCTRLTPAPPKILPLFRPSCALEMRGCVRSAAPHRESHPRSRACARGVLTIKNQTKAPTPRRVARLGRGGFRNPAGSDIQKGVALSRLAAFARWALALATLVPSPWRQSPAPSPALEGGRRARSRASRKAWPTRGPRPRTGSLRRAARVCEGERPPR